MIISLNNCLNGELRRSLLNFKSCGKIFRLPMNPAFWTEHCPCAPSASSSQPSPPLRGGEGEEVAGCTRFRGSMREFFGECSRRGGTTRLALRKSWRGAELLSAVSPHQEPHAEKLRPLYPGTTSPQPSPPLRGGEGDPLLRSWSVRQSVTQSRVGGFYVFSTTLASDWIDAFFKCINRCRRNEA